VTTVPSFCRACMNCCPTLVEVQDGRVRQVEGDPANEIFDGYTCLKGRAEPARHNHPDRLLHSLKRMPDGTYRPIGSEQAMDEIATKLSELLERHGPRCLASYSGNAAGSDALMSPFLGALLRAVGSPMTFSPNTIDKPGKSLALAMHGAWMAPLTGYQEPEVAILVGANPLKSYYGAASGNPGKWLREQRDRGMQLIVIDPRRSDIAKRANLHLQARPGTDPAMLACLIHVILAEELFDEPFVSENARGLDELRAAVAPFTPAAVAAEADVDPEDLRRVARLYAGARRGYIACGVGPGFAKSSTLLEYLTLVIETLSGHWLRAGERVERMPTLLPAGPYRAQAADPVPAYGLGAPLRVRGLTPTTAGLPTGALAEEILLPGEGKVRALFCAGGNPMTAWPDQLKTIEALRSLDLLVQIDPWMSATARLAHFVIAPPMFYEKPGITMTTDFMIQMPTYYGPAVAHAQYTEAVVSPPPGSDLLPEWEFIYGIAQRMGLQLEVGGLFFTDEITTGSAGTPAGLDMVDKPTADELLAVMARGGRVALDEVKRCPSGGPFPDPPRYVEPKEPGWTGRFDLANGDMLRDLGAEEPRRAVASTSAEAFPFRLISIRVAHMFNSTLNDASTNHGRGYNPAYMHPDDLDALGLREGDEVTITSARSTIRSIVHPDGDLRRGLVAMAHGYGGLPEEEDRDFRTIGSPPVRLLQAEVVADPYVGMPRIGDVAVAVAAREPHWHTM
jgi:anaerobic selenocysteine-containing dehydrogenase